MYYNSASIDEKSLGRNIDVLNQTRRYLTPQLRHYGDDLINEIRNLNIKGTFIQDYGVNKTPESRKIVDDIYLLFDVNGPINYGQYVDTKKGRIDFMKGLEYLKEKPYYRISYPFDSNRHGHMHVIVLKLPFPEKMPIFLAGQYSKLYTREEISKWIPKTYVVIEEGKEINKMTRTYQVLTRNRDYVDEFKKQLVEELGVRESSFNPNSEYDLPPYMPNEILRYS